MVLAFAGIASGADDVPVQIQLFRPEKVGNLTNAEIVVDRSTTTVSTDANGVAQKKTDVQHWELVGRAEALEVGAKGYTTRTLLTVKKLVGADAVELLPPGTEIEITRAKEVSFVRVDKGEIAPAAIEVLREIFTPRDPNRPTEDEVFGAKEPQKPGASWDIHSDALIRAMPTMQIDPKNITGKSTFKGIEVRGDAKVLHIETQYQCTDVMRKEQPASRIVEPYRMEYQAEVFLPLSLALPVVENRIHTRVQMQMTNSDGSKTSVDTEATSKGKFLPVKGTGR